MKSVTVDARGEQCPLPVVRTLRTIAELTEPCRVEVHVDNAAAVQNLLRMAAGRGLSAIERTECEGHYVVTVLSGEPAAAEAKTAGKTPDVGARSGGTVVAIGADHMGEGDEALGKTLMKGFLFALSRQEQLPRSILFYNGGACLTTDGSAALEDLKGMETQGVEILTCGTCLNYYGLTDKLAVGAVTNMYDIVEKLDSAAHIIKP